MKRHEWMVVVTLAFAACSDSHEHTPGSQTHFLETCSTSCAAPYDCICGVCTLSCSRDAQCTDYATAECAATPAGDGAQCGGESQMCDVRCDSASDCKTLGAQYTCQAGRCRTAEIITHPVQELDAGGHAVMTMPFDAGSTDTLEHMTDSGTMVVDSGPITGDAGMRTPICDGSDALRLGVLGGNIGFGVSQGAAFMRGPFMVVDGKCRFYASWNGMKGILTGTLDAAEADQLEQDLGWDMLPSYGQYMKYDPQCADGGGAVISDGTSSFACLCGCDPAAPSSLGRAYDAASDWIKRLEGEGEGLTGAVTAAAVMFSGGTPPPGDPQLWPLLTPITDIVAPDGSLGGQRFDDPSDSSALRAMRLTAVANFADASQIYATDGAQDYLLYVRDEFDADMQSKFDAFAAAVQSIP
jgi:hypothetical protein